MEISAGRVVRIEQGSPARTAFVYDARSNNCRTLFYPLSEIAFVKLFSKNGFYDFLQLRECEHLRQEGEAERLIEEMLLQHLVCIFHHCLVVRIQCRELVNLYPSQTVLFA